MCDLRRDIAGSEWFCSFGFCGNSACDTATFMIGVYPTIDRRRQFNIAYWYWINAINDEYSYTIQASYGSQLTAWTANSMGVCLIEIKKIVF